MNPRDMITMNSLNQKNETYPRKSGSTSDLCHLDEEIGNSRKLRDLVQSWLHTYIYNYIYTYMRGYQHTLTVNSGLENWNLELLINFFYYQHISTSQWFLGYSWWFTSPKSSPKNVIAMPWVRPLLVRHSGRRPGRYQSSGNFSINS